MSLLKVARLGHPVLRRKAEMVSLEDLRSPEIQRLIDDMIDTMRDCEGVGLAAPQVHVPLQIAVIEVHDNQRYPESPAIPLTVLINPHVSALSQELCDLWEGCLSIPDLRGIVPRHQRLVCEAQDRLGHPIRIEAEGFLARVIQHEWDHLHGQVYLDRMPDLQSLAHLAEYYRFQCREE